MYNMSQKADMIAVIDDEEVNRFIIGNFFKEQFKIMEAEDGQKGIALIEENYQSIAVILLDLIMPVIDGFGVLEYLKSKPELSNIPVILITGDNSVETEEKSFAYGVYDFISKPFEPRIVMRRVKNAIDHYYHTTSLEEAVEEKTKKIREQSEILDHNNEIMIDALSSVVEFRNLESGEHIKRIKPYTRIILRYIQKFFPEHDITDQMVNDIARASAMHDIGKIAIPDNILLKPGRLTEDEFEVMKKHSEYGCELLEHFSGMNNSKFFDYCYEICRHHHERIDRRGYPDHLTGDEIPIYVQAVALADVYDALTSKRVYKSAYEHEKAIEMILNGECGAFCETILDCFTRAKADFLQVSLAG